MDIERAVNRILLGAISQTSTDAILLEVLDTILSIPWLSLDCGGGIFLSDEDSSTLTLQVHRGLSDTVLRECAHVPFGECVCGAAAASLETQHCSHVGEGHRRIPAEGPHGHYCTPIVSEDRCLGVILLYLADGHGRSAVVDSFLDASSTALAAVLERHRTQSLLAESQNQLAAIVDAFGGLLYMCSRDYRVEYMNARFTELLGHDAVGETCYETIHGLEDVCSWCTNDRVLAGETLEFEVRLKQDGRDYLVLNRPLVHADGRVSKLSMATDVTDYKKAQRDLEATVVRLDATLWGVVDALSETTSQRDPYTALHQERVSRLACAIARELGHDSAFIEGLRVAGLLHDMGKIAVPTAILTKPSSLSEMEMGIVKTHASVGFELLQAVPFGWPVAKTVLQHHERIDGSGYPDGLCGDEISAEAKILAVADLVEATSSARPYRTALGLDGAVREAQKLSGRTLDSDAVAACVCVVEHGGFAP
jgi:putative nucleotidyltransferase with HDIG domain